MFAHKVFEERPRSARQAQLPDMEGMAVQLRATDVWQDVFEPSCFVIGLHHVIRKKRNSFAFHREVAHRRR